ncbi:hypothetical protein J6590_007306 [Homalodisca vitripennis]|nr:hypothetical protein J6590_007306 [Homalodisca vitripennis]
MSELFAELFALVYTPPATPSADYTHNDYSYLAGFLLTRTDLPKALAIDTLTQPGDQQLKGDFRTTINGRAGELLARTGLLSGHPPKQ